MKKRNAESKYSPAIPVSGRSEYVEHLLADVVSKRLVPPVPMGEFSAPEFSIEPVKGARAFGVDKLGRLCGVTYAQVWTPGENVAECRARDDSLAGYLRSIQIQYGQVFASGGYMAPTLSRSLASPQYFPEPKPTPKGPHSIVDCGCGFYGYYDGSNDYYKPERVSGIVEGYGEVVIGTRGFRATKARLVALTIPETVPFPLASRVRRNYRDIPVYDSFADMVAAHPTDDKEGPSPETDPDFWTRVAP